MAALMGFEPMTLRLGELATKLTNVSPKLLIYPAKSLISWVF